MRIYPGDLVAIIKDSHLNINQISNMSGVSNTYLTKLVKGHINHPGKDKIASVLLALNHRVTRINEILALYDYQPLNRKDIPQVLENNRKRKIEGRIVHHYDSIYFEMVLASLEIIGGAKIIIKGRPSSIFFPMELYMKKEFPFEKDHKAASFLMEFIREVVFERRRQFKENYLAGFQFESFMCEQCLGDYLDRNINAGAREKDKDRVDLYIRYFANAVAATLKYPELNRHRIVKRCSYFTVQIQDAYGKIPKVSITSARRHNYTMEWEQPLIQGLLSDAPSITEAYLEEAENCRAKMVHTEAGSAPEAFHDYIRKRFDDHGLKVEFDTSLDRLMASPDFQLY